MRFPLCCCIVCHHVVSCSGDQPFIFMDFSLLLQIHESNFHKWYEMRIDDNCVIALLISFYISIWFDCFCCCFFLVSFETLMNFILDFDVSSIANVKTLWMKVSTVQTITLKLINWHCRAFSFVRFLCGWWQKVEKNQFFTNPFFFFVLLLLKSQRTKIDGFHFRSHSMLRYRCSLRSKCLECWARLANK